MTQDEIIEMARQAGIIAVHTEGDGNWHQQFLSLEAFAKLVAAKERHVLLEFLKNLSDDHTPTQCADMICILQEIAEFKPKGKA